MYTFEFDNNSEFYILDPDGDFIASVITREMAEALISHLNRNIYK